MNNYVDLPDNGSAILDKAFDPATDSIRTTVSANISGAQEIIISAADDSIKIGNGTGNFASVNADGSLNTVGNNSGVIGQPAPASGSAVAAIDANGKLQNLQVDPSGKLLVDISGSSTVTGSVNASIEGLTSFQTSQYSINTSAVQLTPTPLTNRSSMSIKAICTSANLVYIGNNSSVSTSNGYPLFNGDSVQLDLTPAQSIYAVSNASGQKLYILEIGS